MSSHQIADLSGIVDAAAAHWLTPGEATYQNPPVGWGHSNYWQVPNLTSYATFHGVAFGLVGDTSPRVLSNITYSTSLIQIK